MGIRNKILFFIFAFVLLLNFASAENISLSYPEEVGLGEEFEVTLRLIDFSDDIYDVKIDLLSNGKRVAKILNYDEWKSTYYYVNDIINNSEEKDFLLKIEKEFEEATIDVKIKSKDTITFTGYTIGYNFDYVNSSTPEQPQTTQNETSEEEDNPTTEETVNNEPNITQSTSSATSSPRSTTKAITLEPIDLNSKDIKSEDNKEILKKNLALAGVVTFCFGFGALFLLRTLRRKKENEFR